MRTTAITSSKNSLIQELRRAQATGRPTSEGFVVAEGPHLLDEAKRGSWTIEQVFATPEARSRYAHLLEPVTVPVIEVSAKTMRGTAQTEATQGILTLLAPASFSWNEISRQVHASKGLIVVLDGIQDPGNAGTIVRSAEAFGATAVILTSGSVRITNSKFLRATAGSLFRLPYLEAVSADLLRQHLTTNQMSVCALVAHCGKALDKVNWRNGRALLVGNEGAGISPILLEGAECCHIPTGSVESLNAGVACSLALYERGRQRRTG